ncbi:MAG: hypothetical protein ACYTDT_01815 [Planctomycetota bacterium]|jgi:hypothetical protein
MGTNRINDQMPDGDADVRIIVVQTPIGIMKVALPIGATLQGNPLETAMEEFQTNVDAGHEDPLQVTLNNLKDLSDEGQPHPLMVGLALLEQMSSGGMLPPMQQILEGTAVTSSDVSAAQELVVNAEPFGPNTDSNFGPDIDEQIDRTSLN